MHRDCSCLRQPLSQSALRRIASSPCGEPFGLCNTAPKLSPRAGDSSRARPVDDKARGESGGIGSVASGSKARRPYSNQRSWHEVTKGEWLKEAKCREVFPLSLFTIVHRQLPRKRWSLLVRFTNSYIKPALKGEVDASATSGRRGCIGAALIYGNPSVNPPCGVLPAPRPGSLLA